MEVRWGKNAFNFEGTPSGPQPLRNLSRLPNGKANAGQLVGDFRNPILTPEAAAIVSTGSMDTPISLPAMERVVGSSTIRIRPEVGGVPLAVDGPVELSNRYELFGDANPVGFQRTGCREW